MDPITAMILSTVIGGIGSAIFGGGKARQEARQEQERREAAEKQRKRVQDYITRLRDVSYADVDMAASQAYTNADNQAAASAAARGVQGGAANAARDRVLAQAIGQLAQFKQQDQTQREQLVQNALNDDSFDVSDAPVDVNGAMLAGGLTAFGGGIANGAGEMLGSPQAMASMSSRAPTTTGAQASFNEGAGSLSTNLGARSSRGDGGLGSMQVRQGDAQTAGLLAPTLIRQRNASVRG